MKKYYEELLEEFVRASSTSGRSEEVATIFKRHAEGFNFITGVDILGSVVARLDGQTCYLDSGYKRRILITAHQDCVASFSSPSNFKLDKSTRGKYKATGMDNKAGLLSMCILMDSILKTKIFDDVYFVATALEKSGPQGLIVSAEKIKPTIAINIDTIEVAKKSHLGKGPIIIDGPFINKYLSELTFEVATKNKIPIRHKDSNLKSNYSKVSQTAGGIACCDIRIPLYASGGYETVSKKDIENCAKLVHKLVIDINKIESFVPEV